MRIKAKGVSKNSIVEVLLIYLLLTFDCSFLYENHNMPLGAGTTHLTEILNHYIAVYQYSDFAGAALLKNCAIMGTLQLGSVLVFLFVKMKQKLKNTTTWICVLLIFVLQSLSSSYVFYPSIFAMAILNLNNMSKLKEVN